MNEGMNVLLYPKIMAILSLLLSCSSRELLSPESSGCDLGGVILEKKKHAK